MDLVLEMSHGSPNGAAPQWENVVIPKDRYTLRRGAAAQGQGIASTFGRN